MAGDIACSCFNLAVFIILVAFIESTPILKPISPGCTNVFDPQRGIVYGCIEQLPDAGRVHQLLRLLNSGKETQTVSPSQVFDGRSTQLPLTLATLSPAVSAMNEKQDENDVRSSPSQQGVTATLRATVGASTYLTQPSSESQTSG